MVACTVPDVGISVSLYVDAPSTTMGWKFWALSALISGAAYSDGFCSMKRILTPAFFMARTSVTNVLYEEASEKVFS